MSQEIRSPPQSANVTEGEDITFTCMVEKNGSAIKAAWKFTPSGSSQVPVANGTILITNTSLTGIEMVTVSDGLRTMLTFSGVQREADGGSVVCIGSGNTSIVESDPATLTVQCEYDCVSNRYVIDKYRLTLLRSRSKHTLVFTLDAHLIRIGIHRVIRIESGRLCLHCTFKICGQSYCT